MSDENPKLFISYSWTSPHHEQWVLNLATELRESGVDVILDKWDLREGQDAHLFMEKMVTDPAIRKVALICDQLYAQKADGRSGGVGTETQIISPEMYTEADQSKFVAVVTEKDEEGKAYLPTYYKSRIYIDLSDADSYAGNFEQLLRWIYGKPLYIKPELGKKPSFLTEANGISLGTSFKTKRALDAIRNSKDYCRGAISDYFETFAQNLERFRLIGEEGEFDDKVVENIERFTPYRNEAIEIFLALAQYRNTLETSHQVHRFFEGLIPYIYPLKHGGRDPDNLRFVIHELFLYAVASFLKYECFESVAYLLRSFYYMKIPYQSSTTVPFSIFNESTDSLRHRNSRLKLDRVSVRADLLKQRSTASGIPFQQLIQADFVLYLRSCFDSLRNMGHNWWPETLVYSERHAGAFKIFVRARSKEYFERIKRLFDIGDRKDIDVLVEAYTAGKLDVPKFAGNRLRLDRLMGYEFLATTP